MTLFQKTFLFVLITGLFLSCQKDKAIPKLVALEEGYATVKMNNTVFLDTANGTVNRVNKTIRISSTLNQVLEIIVDGLSTGTYNANLNTDTYIKFTDSNGKVFSTKTNPGSGWVKLNLIDTVTWRLTGSFGGDLYELGTNEKLSLSSGEFNTLPYYEPKGGGGSTAFINSEQMKVDQNQVIANNIFTAASDGNIRMTANDIGAWFRIIFPAVWEPGTYDISSGKIDVLYQLNSSNYRAQSGQIVIEAHDFTHNIVSGTFNFTIAEGNNTKEITEGSFSIMY